MVHLPEACAAVPVLSVATERALALTFRKWIFEEYVVVKKTRLQE
jgi:hypothetical protein